ncbi:hypothetical protein ABVF61_19180 [Roseibium sp. HPY-6]|uniref:hypothetical protein n=1 Tax=Roseibium sp. HPY-6 TaxID=3229852 RepID=UPI00338EFDE6
MTPLSSKSVPELGPDFKIAVSSRKQKKKRIAPLSVRLSKEQRAQLEQEAAGIALNAYVLSKLFDDAKPKRRRRRKKATKQDKAIARALRRLGHCGIATYLVSQIVAVEEGRLLLTDKEEKDLRAAHAELDRIRRDLVEAMGLESEERS